MEEILIHVTAKDELERWSSRLASTCEDAKGVSLAGISQLVGRSESPDSPRKGKTLRECERAERNKVMETETETETETEKKETK